MKCPNCGEKAEADFVDIGVGEERVSPWGCPHCHWVEPSVGAEFDLDPTLDDAFDQCPTCKGRGTVNPLTAPPDFFCAGVADCPHCDGSGRI